MLGSPALIALGSLSGAAPLPRVFSNQQGIETFARRARMEVRLRDGRVMELAVDRAFGQRLAGPIVRRADYAHAALFVGLPGTERRQALLDRAFCAPGDVGRELGVAGPVASVRIFAWSELADDEPRVALEIRCGP